MDWLHTCYGRRSQEDMFCNLCLEWYPAVELYIWTYQRRVTFSVFKIVKKLTGYSVPYESGMFCNTACGNRGDREAVFKPGSLFEFLGSSGSTQDTKYDIVKLEQTLQSQSSWVILRLCQFHHYCKNIKGPPDLPISPYYSLAVAMLQAFQY